MACIGQDAAVIDDDGGSEKGIAYLFHVFNSFNVVLVFILCGKRVVVDIAFHESSLELGEEHDLDDDYGCKVYLPALDVKLHSKVFLKSDGSLKYKAKSIRSSWMA